MTDRQLPPISRRHALKIAGAAGASLALPLAVAACGEDMQGAVMADADMIGADASGMTAPDGGAPPDNGTADADAEAPDDTGAETPQGGLPIPPMLEGELQDGVRAFTLDVQEGQVEWIAGHPTATFGVNGPVLGPSLHFRRGERVRIAVTNSLPVTTTLHWHGVVLPAQSDGGPYQQIAPGETWTTEFDVVQRAVMAWYHPHQMHETARQVYMGIAGLIYIDDPAKTFDLPQTYGQDDLPLVIQDRNFSPDGTHPYSTGKSPSFQERLRGVKGETLLVNGAITPHHVLPGGLVRLRILNGSNARNYHVGFSDNRAFRFIGGDGGLFEQPIEANRVLLAPAERAELLVDFGADQPGDTVQLQSFSGEVQGRLFGAGMGGMMSDNLDQSTFDLMTFEVGGPSSAAINPPASFAPIPAPNPNQAARTRQITLAMGGGTVSINGAQMLSMDAVPDAINFHIKNGDMEIWEVKNTSPMAHPLHVHNRHFRVLDIDGQAPPAYLAGWKDTVLVEPDKTVRLLMDFDGVTDPDFPYMFHCHILEHEDGGMMGQFYLVDA